MSMNLIYQDNNVFIKKRYSTIKIVDEAQTAADKQGDNAKNRTIYSKVFLTYSGMIINPISDVRLIPITNRKSQPQERECIYRGSHIAGKSLSKQKFFQCG
jgi:hypothetical protein